MLNQVFVIVALVTACNCADDRDYRRSRQQATGYSENGYPITDDYLTTHDGTAPLRWGPPQQHGTNTGVGPNADVGEDYAMSADDPANYGRYSPSPRFERYQADADHLGAVAPDGPTSADRQARNKDTMIMIGIGFGMVVIVAVITGLVWCCMKESNE